jgi:hypothetical protein
VRAELDVHGLHGRVARAVLGGLEGVQAADDHAHLRAVVHRRDLRVLEDRPLGHELAFLDADVGDLHAHAGVQPRGQAGADLEAEQPAAEQRVVEALVAHHLGHHVDDRLGEALGRSLGAEDLAHAVGAEALGGVVGDLADHDRGRLGAQLAGQLRSLRKRPD